MYQKRGNPPPGLKARVSDLALAGAGHKGGRGGGGSKRDSCRKKTKGSKNASRFKKEMTEMRKAEGGEKNSGRRGKREQAGGGKEPSFPP